MKKVLCWCLPILIAVITLGVVILNINSNRQPSVIYATKFSYKYGDTPLELVLNDSIILNRTEFNIEPANCTEKILLTTNDSDIIQIDKNTNKITAKQIGTCTLFAYIKSSTTESLPPVQITIIVTNQNETINKQNETLEYTFKLSAVEVFIEFSAANTKDENDVKIVNGSEHLEIIDEEYNKLTVELKSYGVCIIEIDSPLKKITITINIINE